MNISKWALANSKIVYYFVAILVVGGIMSYINMSKLEDPAITVKQAMVVTTFPGASSYEVELQVTDKIEKAIYSMKDIEKTDSYSSADVSIVSVSASRIIPDNEIEQTWDILRRKIADVQSELPDGASASVVIDSYGDVFGMFYAMTSDGYTNEELGDYAELLKREIRGIKGISKVELYGIKHPTIDVAIYEDRIANLGISPLEVISAINGQNSTVYSGYFKSDESRIRVNIEDKFASVEDLGNLIIKGHQSDQILLKDIAKIEESYIEPTRNAFFYDRQPAVGISISALEGTDITKIGKEVEALISELEDERMPLGVECHKVFYQPEKVSEAVDMFLINLLESIAIVIVVLMFAMGFRSGLLLGVTLLVTVIGSLLVLNFMDGTLQRVSLGAFILAMGMLVDNAIVIVDGILIDRNKGLLRSKYLTEIGRKTAMPLLGATLIAIIAFLPPFLSPDTAGVYVRDLFVVLAVSLLLSWVLSLTMVPLQAKSLLKPSPKDSKKTEENASKKRWSQRAISGTLMWALRHRVLSVVFAVILTLGSVWLYKVLPQSFFPDLSYDQLYIEYKLNSSSDSEATAKDLDSIAKYLLSRDDIKHVTSSVGATPSRYNLVRSIATPSMSYGDLIVDFTSEEAQLKAIPELQQYLNDNYPEAYARVKRYNLMYSKYPLEVTFTGADPDILRDLTRQAQAIMEANDKIMLVTSDWEAKVPVLNVAYNQAAASGIGLSRGDVAMSLLASTDGIPLNTLYEGSDSRTIVVKSVDKNAGRIGDITTAPIFSMLPSTAALNSSTIRGVMTGTVTAEDIIEQTLATTPLAQVIDSVEVVWEDPTVIRYNGKRAMRAQANSAFGSSAEDARAEILKDIEAIELPEGYSMVWQGEYQTKGESMEYLMANLPLAIILMIGILIFLFKDYKKPAIILLCVPLLFVGAVLGVWVSGYAFGFVAICGVLGLIGMMIKNGVVLMDEISLQIKSGKEPVSAIIDSSDTRFRPVMMASLTTIFGMIPLLPDAMFGSLAATIMGGLFLGTVVTLVFIPVLYAIFFKVKVRR